MDTRRKILTHAQALETARALRETGSSIALISGYFDVLHPSLIRQLLEQIAGMPRSCVLALILHPPEPLLTAQARVELAAALQVIDYVIDSTQAADFVISLAPDRHIRAQEDHLAIREQLIEHVLARHGHSQSAAGRQSH